MALYSWYLNNEISVNKSKTIQADKKKFYSNNCTSWPIARMIKEDQNSLHHFHLNKKITQLATEKLTQIKKRTNTSWYKMIKVNSH